MSIPSTFKALQLEKPGEGAEDAKRNVAAVRSVSLAKAGPGMVTLKMLAAGFNRRDEWAMLGLYPGLQYTNSTFGCDGVGVVVDGQKARIAQESIGPHPQGLVVLVPTRGWASDPVGPEAAVPGAPKEILQNRLGGFGFGLLGNTKPTNGVGTFAEYAQVEDDTVLNVPHHLSAVQAAALPCGGVTAFRALFTKGDVRSGQNVLITGIGGGVALLALQFAVAKGANVFVTGGTPEKVKRAVELGAKGGVVYRDAEWPKQLAKLVAEKTSQRPYLDVVIDSAGGNVTTQAASAGLRTGGRIVCYGMTVEPKIPFTMREVLRNVDVYGSTMGSAREFREMLELVNEHKIVPIIDTVIKGLDNAHKGFPLLQNADQRSGGKVIVEIAQASQGSPRQQISKV